MYNKFEYVILAGGIFNFCFAVFHLLFWRIFDWKNDLVKLTFINWSIMQILNSCLAFMFMVMGYISIFHAPEMIGTGLGRVLLVMFSLFWLFRMIEQFVFFGARKIASVAFIILLSLGSALYAVPVAYLSIYL